MITHENIEEIQKLANALKYKADDLYKLETVYGYNAFNAKAIDKFKAEITNSTNRLSDLVNSNEVEQSKDVVSIAEEKKR
jgi:hypothetical protein